MADAAVVQARVVALRLRALRRGRPVTEPDARRAGGRELEEQR